MIHQVYIDECGYTGADLFQKDQPFFALAAVPIEESEACVIKKRFFPGLGDQEFKHAKFNGDDKQLESVVGCLEECLNRGSMGIVFYKPFICAEAFLMDMLVPFWPNLQPGSDNYRKVGLHLMNPGRSFGVKKEVESVLTAYINVCKKLRKSKNLTGGEIEATYMPLYDAIIGVSSGLFKTLLFYLSLYGPAYGKQLAENFCAGGCCQGAAFALITQLETLGLKYEMVVDTSPTIREIVPLFKRMRNFPPSEIRVALDTKLRFPLTGFQDVREVDSRKSVSVQLADLVAGTLVRAAYGWFGVVPRVPHEKYDEKIQSVWNNHPMNSLIRPSVAHVDISDDISKLQQMINSSN